MGFLGLLLNYFGQLVTPQGMAMTTSTVIIAVLLRYNYKKILMFFFEDNVVNLNVFHVLNQVLFCRCCCTGDWTRCLTAGFCCPRWLKNRNLVRMLTEYVGIVPQPIRIKKLMVGNVPETQGAWYWLGPQKNDFFVSIDGNETLHQMGTEVLADTGGAGVVQFTSTLTTNVRDSAMENPVRFSLRKSEILGSVEIAHVQVPPIVLIELMHDASRDGNKAGFQGRGTISGGIRLKMTLSEDMVEEGVSRAPWLFVLVAPVVEMDHLRLSANSAMTLVTHDVSYSQIPLREPTDKEAAEPLVDSEAGGQNTAATHFKIDEKDVPPRPIKLDDHVHLAALGSGDQEKQELEFPRLAQKAKDKREWNYWLHKTVVLAFMLFFLPFVYAPCQVAMSICYEEYKMMTVIDIHDGYQPDAPRNASRELQILHSCKMHSDAVAQWMLACKEKEAPHSLFSDPMLEVHRSRKECRPTFTEVIKRCEDRPAGAEVPNFFHVFTCPAWTCAVDNWLDHLELVIIVFVVLCAVSVPTHYVNDIRTDVLDRYFPERRLPVEGRPAPAPKKEVPRVESQRSFGICDCSTKSRP
eukprot:TRINITY_DN15404_c0_g1_i2.p1 TRINITY_DN15404_c0_g1~~TRINITY_DN15404_c0_g1_i2.p1  ORF type:complete len:579 (-),score=59.86 TRINITY_DN15404_c0_g1_i2:510-2246(-)